MMVMMMMIMLLLIAHQSGSKVTVHDPTLFVFQRVGNHVVDGVRWCNHFMMMMLRVMMLLLLLMVLMQMVMNHRHFVVSPKMGILSLYMLLQD